MRSALKVSKLVTLLVIVFLVIFLNYEKHERYWIWKQSVVIEKLTLLVKEWLRWDLPSIMNCKNS
jgi:hypothetical protein